MNLKISNIITFFLFNCLLVSFIYFITNHFSLNVYQLLFLLLFCFIISNFIMHKIYTNEFRSNIISFKQEYPEISDERSFFKSLRNYLDLIDKSNNLKSDMENILKENNLNIKRYENTISRHRKEKEEIKLINHYLLQESGITYAVKNKNSIFLAATTNYAHLFNKDYDEISGKDEFVLFPERKTEQYLEEEKHIFLQKSSLVYDEYINNCWYQVTKKPLYNNGKQFGILETIRDVDQRKQAERLLQESYTKLKQSQEKLLELEQKNSVMAMAVTANHELNQPLTVIKGYIGLLEKHIQNLKDEDSIEKFQNFILTLEEKLIKVEKSADKMAKILEKFRNAESFNFEEYCNNTQMIVFNESKNKV